MIALPIARPIAAAIATALFSQNSGAYSGPSLRLGFSENTYLMGAIGKPPSAYEFDSLITFTRASGGGITNAAGEFEWVGTNVPRITYDPVTLKRLGLLVEEQRTNLLTRSSNVADVAWSKTACTASPAGISPGGLPAEKIIPVAGAGNHFYGQAAGFAGAVDNGFFSISLRIKADGYNHFHIQGKTKSDLYPAANVDLAAGTITLLNASGSATASIEPLSDGWYLCSLSWSVLTGAHPLGMFLTPKPTATNSVSFTADGVSGALVSGHQLEQATSPSSYIPTTTAQVTRAADVATVNTLAPWYNASEGTLVVRFVMPKASGYPGVVRIGQADANYSIGAFLSSGQTITSIVKNATDQAVFTTGGLASGTSKSFAMSYKANDFKNSFNGLPAQSDTSGSVPAVTLLQIGRYGTNNLNGIIENISYYPRIIDVQQASA